jgi:hypothetical protein
MLLTVQADQAFEPSGDPILRRVPDPDIMLSSGCSQTGTDSSNSPRSTIQSLSFRTSRIIDRNPPVCARFAIGSGPGERLRRALNGGMRQNLSARYFARSMEVRPNIALVEGHGDSMAKQKAQAGAALRSLVGVWKGL